MKSLINKRLETTITAAITAAAVTAYIQSSADVPTAPWVGIFDPESVSPEIVLVSAVTTTIEPNSITIVRGCLGMTAKAHGADSVLYQYGEVHQMNIKITDVSTAETLYLPMPKCMVVKGMSALEATIATADAVITLYKNASAMSGGVITIGYDGSAAGDVDTCSPITYNEFNGTTDYLKVVNTGASTTASVGNLTLFYVPEG